MKKLLSHIEYFVVLSILVSLYTSNYDKNDYHDNDSHNDDTFPVEIKNQFFLLWLEACIFHVGKDYHYRQHKHQHQCQKIKIKITLKLKN